MKKAALFFFLGILLFPGSQTATAQDRDEALDALRKALKRPSPAATVGCTDDQIQFKNFKLEDEMLSFMQQSGSTNNPNQATYRIDLEKLSTETFDYDEQRCFTDLVLHSKEGTRAFYFRIFEYVGNRLESIDEGERRIQNIPINKDPRGEVVNALFRLAESYKKNGGA